MTWFQRLTSFWRKPPAVKGIIRQRAMPSGRVSVDAQRPLFGGSLVVAPPPDHESDWRMLNLDARTLDKVAPTRLMELLADLSPEVSKALWDFLRNCNPGWTAQAFPIGTDRADERAETDDNAQAALDAFLGTLRGYHGAADVVWNRLFMAAFLRGAFFAELVLDGAGRMPVDLVTPDPKTVRYRAVSDPIRGSIWMGGQWQNGQFVDFDRPTIRVVPVDPMPGVPYGRPLASPALFSSLFLLGLLHDLRRVVQQQGYPRIDITLEMEKLLAAYSQGPPLVDDQEISFATYIQNTISQIETRYASLEPDDAYIHTDGVVINRPVGTVDAHSLGAITGLIEAVERMAVRALKTMPFALGLSESTTETQSNRQYDLYAAGIRSLQHFAENLLEHLLGLALEAQGIQASVRFRFAQIRSAERIRDAQADSLEIANEARKRDEGWISQDEASQTITGHDAELSGPIVRKVTGGPDVVGDASEGDNAGSRAAYVNGNGAQGAPNG